MANLIRRTVIFLFLGVVVGAFIYFNVTRPRVLVLHSYSADYAWTRDVDVGLTRIFNRHPNYAIRWHYMDTKKHPWPEFARAAGITARGVVENYRPHVLVVVDDDAQRLAGRHFVNDPDIRIVFAGINGSAAPYGYDHADNVTGILERKPVRAVREVIGELARNRGLAGPVRVLFLGDASGSVKQDAEEMTHFDWAPLKFVGARLVESWPQWQQAVAQAHEVADFIVVANYRKLTATAGGKELVDVREVMPWTEKNARIPVIGTNGFNVEDGAALAIGTSPFEQGEVAAQMAVAIIDQGTAPSAIPWRQTEQFTVSIRQGEMLEKRLYLPAVYEAFARVVDSFIPAPVGGIATATLTEAAPAPVPPPPPAAPEPAAPVPAPEPPPPVPEPAAVAAAEPPAQRPLAITVKHRTWVEVRDHDGHRLIAKVVPAGAGVDAAGAPPLTVRLGRVDGVEIRYDAAPVAVTGRNLVIR